MLYLLDTANVDEIRRLYDLYPISGVTTNPSIISKEKKDFFKLLKEIRSIIGEDSMLHVQVLSTDAESITSEAERIIEEVGGRLYIKVPVIPQGIKAIKLLSRRGIRTTATAIFTPQQALMAAAAGADFAAPYINRLDNICSDGVNVVHETVRLYKTYNVNTRVLAASFKNVEQVHKSSLAGVHAITAAPEIIEQLLKHPLTDYSVSKFLEDWEEVYGG